MPLASLTRKLQYGSLVPERMILKRQRYRYRHSFKKIGIMEKIRIKRSICDKIGEQKIDLLVSKCGNEAFFKFAVKEGLKLNA
jgi:hypothetical protein